MNTTSIIFRRSNLYFLVAIALIAWGTAYGLSQNEVLAAENAAIQANRVQRLDKEKLHVETRKTYELVASEQTKRQKEFSEIVRNILPPDENYTELTRTLDEYFSRRDFPSNPIFQSSLRFGKGAPVAGMPAISALPLSMNLEATKDNFFNFLQFMQDSGSVDTGVRLMELNSIQLNFPEGGEVIKDARQDINFTVDLNAYYLTPKVAR